LTNEEVSVIESIELDPKIKVRDVAELLVLPRVIRVRSFNEEGAKTFSKEMSLAHQSGQPVIPVIIDSYGGDVYALMSMIDTIKTATVPVATIVEGKAMSCGVVLFTCGTEGYRFIGPNATLMVHDVSSIEPRKKAEEVKADARETDRLNKKLYRIMEKNIGQPNGYLWQLSQERSRVDWYMMPKEAIKHNIANFIKIPALRTVVSVEMKLEF
jgi:ATP-dependent Clp protease, protease subunit